MLPLALGIFVGLLAGGLAGLLGIGGGILMVPLLMWLFDYSQQQAQGMSLTVMIPPIGIFAAMQYWKRFDVDVPLAFVIALGFVAGSVVSAGFVHRIDQTTLRRFFGLLLAYVAGQMLIGGGSGAWGARLGEGMAWLGAGLASFGLGGLVRRRSTSRALRHATIPPSAHAAANASLPSPASGGSTARSTAADPRHAEADAEAPAAASASSPASDHDAPDDPTHPDRWLGHGI